MKILKMLPCAALYLIPIATAQAKPTTIPGAASKAEPQLALIQGRFSGGKVTSGPAEVDVFQDGKRIARKGDTMRTIEGTPKVPLRFESSSLQLSAQRAVVLNRTLSFSGGHGGPKAKIKFALRPRDGNPAVKVEAECLVGLVAKGKVTLEDGVSGFYEDASGKHELKGDIVTLSAFDNVVSVVQDGVITLSGVPTTR